MYGKITKAKLLIGIKQAKALKKHVTLCDGGGLQLRLSYTYEGKGTWFLVSCINGKVKRHKLGEYVKGKPYSMDFEKARLEAYKLKQKLRNNYSLVNYTVKDICVAYLKHKETILRKNSITRYTQNIDYLEIINIANVEVDKLTPQLVRDRIVTSPLKDKHVAIRNLYTFLISSLNFAIREQMIKEIKLPTISNLFPHLRKSENQKMIEMSELTTMIDECIALKMNKVNYKYLRAFILILCSACRLKEINNLSLGEREDNWWLIPAERMKSKREHLVYLVEDLLPLFATFDDLISTSYFRQGILQDKYEFTFHGFRSLFMTRMYQMHPELKEAISACIAHGKDHVHESDKYYNRYDFRDERKFLFSKWYEYLKEHTNIQQLIALLVKHKAEYM
ncbi:tyrosine-type recombinase/integrase [Psittacicella gerlachiana]|uniref:Phage integrase family protein n=1 Tax=Psittacicella gerlachiana TaxID=2028574 RepID=A0A3A1Y2N8_9GAMM|nr:integrase family protein [Psittacicella gerlachiana]RIY31549.1 hypothetical protein CKF59_07570 [Psittacicella gerlachiana]